MNLVKDLRDYQTRCERVKGFKKLQSAGLRIPRPLKIVTPQAFEEYKQHGLTKRLKEEIKAAFLEIRKKNPSKGVIARRAYFVPGLENPPGPRSASVRNKEILIDEVRRIFDFAIKNKFDKRGSEIAVFLHPFINPVIPLTGGCVTPSKRSRNEAVIEAIYGNDEGVQSFPHDQYVVNFEEKTIGEKRIRNKIQCLKVTDQLNYKIIDVSENLRTRQVLEDEIILKIGDDFGKLVKKLGPHRLEFNLLKDGIYYTESTPFEIKEEPRIGVRYSGKVVSVRTLKDVERIKEGNKVIFVHPSVVAKRNMDLLTCLACNIPHRMLVLYPGTASTAHAATILREMGHIIAYVGDQTYREGEQVITQLEDGELVAKRLHAFREFIVPLDDVRGEHQQIIGGKAYHLAQLKTEGFNVPKGFVVTTQAFDYSIEENNLTTLIEKLTLARNQKFLGKICSQLQKEIIKGKIPSDLKKEILETFKIVKFVEFAVRSSASCEDSAATSFAGQFESYLNIAPDKLLHFIKVCWASIYTERVIAYSSVNKIPLYSVKMAVLVQEMIEPDKAGVIFTKNVISDDDSCLVIEASKGLGEKVVSGTVIPDRFVMAKKSLGIISQKLKGKKSILTKREIKKLARIGKRIEKLYKKPQDIEWAIKNRKIFILQARPITT